MCCSLFPVNIGGEDTYNVVVEGVTNDYWGRVSVAAVCGKGCYFTRFDPSPVSGEKALVDQDL